MTSFASLPSTSAAPIVGNARIVAVSIGSICSSPIARLFGLPALAWRRRPRGATPGRLTASGRCHFLSQAPATAAHHPCPGSRLLDRPGDRAELPLHPIQHAAKLPKFRLHCTQHSPLFFDGRAVRPRRCAVLLRYRSGHHVLWWRSPTCGSPCPRPARRLRGVTLSRLPRSRAFCPRLRCRVPAAMQIPTNPGGHLILAAAPPSREAASALLRPFFFRSQCSTFNIRPICRATSLSATFLLDSARYGQSAPSNTEIDTVSQNPAKRRFEPRLTGLPKGLDLAIFNQRGALDHLSEPMALEVGKCQLPWVMG